MGGNPPENHPCGFKWAMEAKRNRNAKLISVDPRFTRTSATADLFLQIRAGTDIAFLGGLIRYAIENNRIAKEYLINYTNAAFIVKEGFKLPENGLYSGFDPAAGTYDKSTWNYEEGGDLGGKAARGESSVHSAPAASPPKLPPNVAYDLTLQHPRCVFQLLKQQYSRYTPETVERITGIPKEKYLKAVDMFTSVRKNGDMKKVSTIIYAVGWTQHTFGTQIIRTAAMVQLLLGNVGRAGGGVNALRGHSNIQGATDMAGLFDSLPGYLKTPIPADTDLATYLKRITPEASKQVKAAQASSLCVVIAITETGDVRHGCCRLLDGEYAWMQGVLEGVMAVATEAREPEVADLVEAPAPPRVPQTPDSLLEIPWLLEHEMFSDSLLESSRREKRRRKFATGVSFVFQCLLIGLLLIVPLMFTEALPTQQLLTFLVAPPPPPPPPPPAGQAAAEVVRQVKSDLLGSGQLRTPSRIPKQVQMIREEEAPPMFSTGGMVGGVPGGVPGGQLGGVIGGIVSQTSTIAIVPKLTLPARPIRVSRGVTEGLLMRKVAPEYPIIARQARVQGQVLLNAIISKTGDIENLTLVSGHPLLVPAALEAVKQWHYRPYQLNGEPVDVETTICVTFVITQ